jgi:very-short-patch-repair endonuclease
MNTSKFILNAIKKHGDKYDYNKVEYINNTTKIIITCPIHGDFFQTPKNHIAGQGCKKCGYTKILQKNRHTTLDIIAKCVEIHGDTYDYTLVDYVNYYTKIKIQCKKHGIFQQTPKSHILKKSGCPKCAIEYKANKLKLSQEEFIETSNNIHNRKYDYSLVNYINNKTKVTIICPNHGMFQQAPVHHMRGIGCPICNESKGESIIAEFLNNENILYIREKSFDNCIDNGNLRFDFYLPDLNIVIEFDGIQHYKPIDAFGGKSEFLNIKRRDLIKNNYCFENKIRMIRIKYNENIINKLNCLVMKDK